MKILVLGLPALKSGFQELGHDVLTCTTDNTGDIGIPEIPISIDRLWQQLPQGWEPDFVLLTDESTHPLFLGLERLDIPLGWYAIDSHIHHRWHQAYAAAFDFIFVAQKDYVSIYVRDEARQSANWLPLFCQRVANAPVAAPYEHEISFVGSINPYANRERCEFLMQLTQRCPIHVATGAYFPIYSQSKMVLNQCFENDVNFRTFEAMACGSLLVMEHVGNGLEELFQNGIHCVFYEKDNIDQIVDIVEYYVSHDDERKVIAAEGWDEVSSKHRSVHRARTILEMVNAADCQHVVRQRLSRQGEILFLLASVYEYVAYRYGNSMQMHDNQSRISHRRMAIADRFGYLASQIHRELAI